VAECGRWAPYWPLGGYCCSEYPGVLAYERAEWRGRGVRVSIGMESCVDNCRRCAWLRRFRLPLGVTGAVLLSSPSWAVPSAVEGPSGPFPGPLCCGGTFSRVVAPPSPALLRIKFRRRSSSPPSRSFGVSIGAKVGSRGTPASLCATLSF
jgi:hypothetical protein